MPTFDHTPEPAERDARLRAGLVGWLATVRSDARPHLVPVWFLWDGAGLLITSQPGSRKVLNIRENARVSFALDDSQAGHSPIMLEGKATLQDVVAGEPDVEGFFTKYRTSLAEMEWDEVDARADYRQAIRITVERFLEF